MGQDAPWESNKLSHGAFPSKPRVIKLKGDGDVVTLPPDGTWAATGFWQQLVQRKYQWQGWWVLAS